MDDKSIREVLKQFTVDGTCLSCEKYGSGHINDTFLVRYVQNGTEKKYILQRINTEVFKKPEELMENVYRVTTFLSGKIIRQGGNPLRESMNLISTRKRLTFLRDSSGSCWRMYIFIDNAHSYDMVRTPDDLYNAAFAFGRFQNMLADFPAASLHDTIPGFHDTPARFEIFMAAVTADRYGRADSVREEIAFFKEYQKQMGLFMKAHRENRIPLRVTHNDTKLTNVLLDDKTGKGLCVIDLDTVMPGFAGFDFGDLIRFGASTAAEDEQDLSKVSLDISLFKMCAEGFLKGCGGSLTDSEIKMLPDGAEIMILESGVRFLTDYLEGDIYFKVQRKNHNLDRCRTQIQLVRDFEKKHMLMNDYIQKAMHLD